MEYKKKYIKYKNKYLKLKQFGGKINCEMDECPEIVDGSGNKIDHVFEDSNYFYNTHPKDFDKNVFICILMNRDFVGIEDLYQTKGGHDFEYLKTINPEWSNKIHMTGDIMLREEIEGMAKQGIIDWFIRFVIGLFIKKYEKCCINNKDDTYYYDYMNNIELGINSKNTVPSNTPYNTKYNLLTNIRTNIFNNEYVVKLAVSFLRLKVIIEYYEYYQKKFITGEIVNDFRKRKIDEIDGIDDIVNQNIIFLNYLEDRIQILLYVSILKMINYINYDNGGLKNIKDPSLLTTDYTKDMYNSDLEHMGIHVQIINFLQNFLIEPYFGLLKLDIGKNDRKQLFIKLDYSFS